MIPSLGRTVHYVLPEEHRHKGQHRAARISQVWAAPGSPATEETSVALAVDLDPLNDPYEYVPLLSVRNSVQDPHGKMPGSWHEPERTVVPAAEKVRAKPAAAELQPA